MTAEVETHSLSEVTAGRFDMDAWVARSRALDRTGIRWDEVERHPLSAEALRTVQNMQQVESHTSNAGWTT